jgi:SAM-dependent methyltransferase
VDPNVTKQRITDTFNMVADGYLHPAARFFPSAANALVELLEPQPGFRTLDVATGTGVVSTTIAPIIAPGRVDAIDLSEGMLRQQEKAIDKLGLTNIELHVMDAEALDFREDYFDAVTCSFGLFFLPDMEKGLKEWRRVTKPGGTILFTSFGRDAFQPLTKLFLDRIEAYGIEIPNDRTRMGWYPLSTPEQGRTLMETAGITNIEISSRQLGYHLGSADDWWELTWNAGYRSFLLQLSDQQLDRFRQEHLAEIVALKGEQGIWMDVEVLFFKGSKA